VMDSLDRHEDARGRGPSCQCCYSNPSCRPR
jgi:hypothetical protein